MISYALISGNQRCCTAAACMLLHIPHKFPFQLGRSERELMVMLISEH
jgi:hypothetical protein